MGAERGARQNLRGILQALGEEREIGITELSQRVLMAAPEQVKKQGNG